MLKIPTTKCYLQGGFKLGPMISSLTLSFLNTVSIMIIILHLFLFSRKRFNQRTGNTDNNRVSIRREDHHYEEIEELNLVERVPDCYEDVDVVSDRNPPPVVPRTDLDVDGYLNLEGQQDNEYACQTPASGNDDAPLFEDQRHDTEGYLKPVPSNHDVIESKCLTPPLPGATASPYSRPYDHVLSWQKSLQLRLNRPQ